jgi:hypothetical protein
VKIGTYRGGWKEPAVRGVGGEIADVGDRYDSTLDLIAAARRRSPSWRSIRNRIDGRGLDTAIDCFIDPYV